MGRLFKFVYELDRFIFLCYFALSVLKGVVMNWNWSNAKCELCYVRRAHRHRIVECPEVLEVQELLERFLRPEDVDVWLDVPHPDLGNRTPRQIVNEGRARALVTLLSNALNGIPS